MTLSTQRVTKCCGDDLLAHDQHQEGITWYECIKCGKLCDYYTDTKIITTTPTVSTPKPMLLHEKIEALASDWGEDSTELKESIKKELESLTLQVDMKAVRRRDHEWLKAVYKQRPIFLTKGFGLAEAKKVRIARRVRCVEILQDMGFDKEAEKLLQETRKLKEQDL